MLHVQLIIIICFLVYMPQFAYRWVLISKSLFTLMRPIIIIVVCVNTALSGLILKPISPLSVTIFIRFNALKDNTKKK